MEFTEDHLLQGDTLSLGQDDWEKYLRGEGVIAHTSTPIEGTGGIMTTMAASPEPARQPPEQELQPSAPTNQWGRGGDTPSRLSVYVDTPSRGGQIIFSVPTDILGWTPGEPLPTARVVAQPPATAFVFRPLATTAPIEPPAPHPPQPSEHQGTRAQSGASKRRTRRKRAQEQQKSENKPYWRNAIK